MAAQFEIRQLRLDAARKILGMAIGMCPKVRARPPSAARVGARCTLPFGRCRPGLRLLPVHSSTGRSFPTTSARRGFHPHLALPAPLQLLSGPSVHPATDRFTPPCLLSPPLPPQDKLFKSYVEMELQLGNIDRCRTLYQKYIEWGPANAGAWGRCADSQPEAAWLGRLAGGGQEAWEAREGWFSKRRGGRAFWACLSFTRPAGQPGQRLAADSQGHSVRGSGPGGA